MSQLRADFADALSLTFNQIFMDTYSQYKGALPYSNLFEEVNVDSKDYKISSYTGLEPFQYVSEGEAMPADTIIQGWDKTITPVKIGKSLGFSAEALDDIQTKYSDVSSQIKALANGQTSNVVDSARMVLETVDSACAEIFKNHVTSGTYTWGASTLGADGKVLCANDHPLNPQDTTALDNLYTGTLSHDNLGTFKTQIRKNMKDPRGNFISLLWPSVLLVPPDLEDAAERIINTPGRTDSSNNDINVNYKKFTVQVWNKLTDTTDWFLVVPRHGLKLYWRKMPTYSYEYIPSTQMHKFYCSARFVPAFIDWRSVWGSSQ